MKMPRSLTDYKNIYFNKKVYKMVKKLYDNLDEAPNIIINGGKCSGKLTLANLLLESVFKKKIKLKKELYVIHNSSGKSIEIEMKQSDCHLLIEPLNTGIDKYLVDDILNIYLEQYDNYRQNLFGDVKYRFVIINRVDQLSQIAQASLRRTMERFAFCCKFIFINNCINNIIEPLKSRCVLLKLVSASKIDKLNYIMDNSSTQIKMDELTELLQMNFRDIKWNLYFNKIGIPKYESPKEILIQKLIEIIKTGKHSQLNGTDIQIMRTHLYDFLLITDNPITLIHRIIEELMETIEDKVFLFKILKLCSQYTTRINCGKRLEVHLESFIINLLNLLE